MNTHLYSKNKVLSIIIFLFIFIFIALNGKSEAGENKDLILVLDTSLSMVGYGGKNIFPKVKENLPRFIEQLEEDDTITFMTFDTDVKVYPTVYIDDEHDKDIIKKYISMTEARGKWTYTSEMLRHALEKAQDLEKKDEDRQRVIVVMTDALDDPPPGNRSDTVKIREIARPYSEKDWFILLMNFGEIKKNKALAKQIEGITKYTKVIDSKISEGSQKETDKDVQDAIEKDLKKNIEAMEAKKREESSPIGAIIIAILIIAAILVFLFYLKRFSQLKVYGKLDYWDHTVISPYEKSYDLTRLNQREVAIGKQGNLRLSDIEVNDPFVIAAVRDNGEIKLTLISGKGYNIEFVNREPGRFLQSGDMFKVANYTFRYVATAPLK